MIIQVDQEAKEIIEGYCGMALKVGDLKNLDVVNKTLDSLVLISKPKEPDKKPDEQKK